MKKSYLIYSPPFDNSAAGIVVMQRMAVEIQKRGYEVFINTEVQNPKWDKVKYLDPLSRMLPKTLFAPDLIAIYPDIIHDNPFNAKTVVRYMLNIPEYSGGPPIETYPPSDIFYTYSRLFNTKLHLPEDRVMYCPSLDMNMFYDMKLKRSGRLTYRGKFRGQEDERLMQFPSLGGKEDFHGEEKQNLLRKKLNRCELLYCYDNATAMTEISRLCGCPVVVIPDGSYSYEDCKKYELWFAGGLGYGILESAVARSTINSEFMAKCYEAAEVEFQRKLTDFINLTQEI